MGVINAARDNVPLLLLSGRTPAGEGGRTGSRDLPIHWGQEMRDQGAMVREVVKWDYELRLPEQVPELIDRALAIAMSPPMGPVYLSLPREVLCSASGRPGPAGVSRASAPPPRRCRRAAALEEAAALIAAAERPLILTQRAGAFAAGFDALADFAQRFALPVIEFWPSRISLPVDHPMHAGFDPAAALAKADLVLALDALTPWIPSGTSCPRAAASSSSAPIRCSRRRRCAASRAIWLWPAMSRPASACSGPRWSADWPATRSRSRARAAPCRRQARRARPTARRRRRGTGLADVPAFLSRQVAQALPDDAILFSELGCDPSVMSFTRPGSYFGFPPSGGLGWGLHGPECDGDLLRVHPTPHRQWSAGRRDQRMTRNPPAPLYTDPVHLAPTDPTVIEGPDGRWWMFYTQRRATDTGPGVSWVHGTDIAVAESHDGGLTWTMPGRSTASTRTRAATRCGRLKSSSPRAAFHMFLSYISGVPSRWEGHGRHILHHVSDDLRHWSYRGMVPLTSSRVIDAAVHPRPGGGYRMWFKDEAHRSWTWGSDSDDLQTWSPGFPVITGPGHEGPNVFELSGQFWMIVDEWRGLAVYASPDLDRWERQGLILDRPGRRRLDRPSVDTLTWWSGGTTPTPRWGGSSTSPTAVTTRTPAQPAKPTWHRTAPTSEMVELRFVAGRFDAAIGMAPYLDLRRVSRTMVQ